MMHDCITYECITNTYKRLLFDKLMEAPRGTKITPWLIKAELKNVLACWDVKGGIRESTMKEINALFIACGFTDNDHDGIYWK